MDIVEVIRNMFGVPQARKDEINRNFGVPAARSQAIARNFGAPHQFQSAFGLSNCRLCGGTKEDRVHRGMVTGFDVPADRSEAIHRDFGVPQDRADAIEREFGPHKEI